MKKLKDSHRLPSIFPTDIALAYVHIRFMVSFFLLQQATAMSAFQLLIYWSIMNIALILFDNYIFALIHLGSLYTPLAWGMVYTVNVKVQECIHSLRQGSMRNQVRRAFLMVRFQRTMLQTVVFILNGNKVFGPMLFMFILGQAPLSSTILVVGLAGRQSLSSKVLFHLLVIGQFQIIIFFHYAAAWISESVHSPYQGFISMNVRLVRVPIYWRLKWASHIAAFHTSKRYGITYGSFGLISMFAFYKVSVSERQAILNLNFKNFGSFSIVCQLVRRVSDVQLWTASRAEDEMRFPGREHSLNSGNLASRASLMPCKVGCGLT